MKLHSNPASPFVRMVRVVARELGLENDIEEVHTGAFVPMQVHEGVSADNPLGRIPALVTDHGHGVHDSRVIMEYLLHRAGDKTLLPDEPVARFRILTLQSMAIGLADTGVALRYETAVRPKEMQWPELIERQGKRITNVLDCVERDWADDLAEVNVGTIALASVLGYLDFRYPDLGWRDGRPKLTAFYETFSQRPSMVSTPPE